jgi:replicative superfamily II helicase
MIESLMKEGLITFVACTSTLAEGINLPAKNLFLKNPAQAGFGPNLRIEDVKINNITGRAGRMLQHFSGNIFLVEPEDWDFKDYFKEENDLEQKIPTYFRALNDDLTSILDALSGVYTHDQKDQYTYYTIANKLIKEFANGNFEHTLDADELTIGKNEKELLRNNVEAAFASLKVATFTLEANPTMGYIQQNKLFAFLSEQENLSDWTLPYPKSTKLYDSLLKIMEVLHDTGVYIPSESYTLSYICLISKKWMQGDSLKNIIIDQIAWDKSNENSSKKINQSVRSVITVINNDIGFRLSNALKCYQILLNIILKDRDINLPNIKLHTYVEIGACEERMITLINFGLSRESAKEIDDKLPQSEVIKTVKDLLDLDIQRKLNTIHPVTRRELQTLLS